MQGIDSGAPQRIAIWGAAGHAKVVADAMRATGAFDIVGFIDDTAPQRRGEAFCGAEVLGGRDALPTLRAGQVALMLAFGHNAARLALAAEMEALGFAFPIVIHPAAVVSPQCGVGTGTFIAAGAVVNADATIGAHAIINTGAVVEHDSRVGDGAHLSPRACLSGRVSVGRGAWIGAGAVVRDGVAIGDGAIIGMGAVVLQNIPDAAVAYGCPARVIRMLGKD